MVTERSSSELPARRWSRWWLVAIPVLGLIAYVLVDSELTRHLITLLIATTVGVLAGWHASNIYNLRRSDAASARAAYYDRLTGLPNYVYFDERLRRALADATAHGRSLALYVIGLSRLREINEALGFQSGDLLLKAIGNRLRDVMPGDALAARLRGDEFALLQPTRQVSAAKGVAERLLNAFKTPFVISGLELDVGATIGISLHPEHGSDATHFLRHADVAMQRARKSGQGYLFYAPEHEADSTRRLSLAAELRRAIDTTELVLYYQPKLNMRDASVCGAEALVRWNHPSRG